MTTSIGALTEVVRRRIGKLTGWSMRPTRRIGVVLWGKNDCSLCDKAEAILVRLARDFPLDVEKRDIGAQTEVFERYRYVIPVVEFVDGPTIEGKITEHRLRQILLEGFRPVERD